VAPFIGPELVFWLFLGKPGEVPFLYDFSFHLRFLLATPLLFMAEGIADKRVKLILNQFNKAGLLFRERQT
jgi:hypothetical protein